MADIPKRIASSNQELHYLRDGFEYKRREIAVDFIHSDQSVTTLQLDELDGNSGVVSQLRKIAPVDKAARCFLESFLDYDAYRAQTELLNCGLGMRDIVFGKQVRKDVLSFPIPSPKITVDATNPKKPIITYLFKANVRSMRDLNTDYANLEFSFRYQLDLDNRTARLYASHFNTLPFPVIDDHFQQPSQTNQKDLLSSACSTPSSESTPERRSPVTELSDSLTNPSISDASSHPSD